MIIAHWQEKRMNEFKEGYLNKLKNKLYGLLCEFEKNRDWEKYLDSIIIELLGISEEHRTINYYILFHKISSLRYLKYEYFRTTIFDCMTLLGKNDIF